MVSSQSHERPMRVPLALLSAAPHSLTLVCNERRSEVVGCGAVLHRPAVSQICSLILLPSRSMVLILKSILAAPVTDSGEERHAGTHDT